MNEIIKTDDGSNTLFSKKFNEQYHSTFGAIQESNHIFIHAGLNHCQNSSIRIFEVGFGTGLNTILTYAESIKKNLTIEYTAIELYPVELNIVNQLNYLEFLPEESKNIFKLFHSCNWDEKIKISENFSFQKIESDFNKYNFSQKIDLIYFDAFAPEKQPDMWRVENFIKLFNSLNKNGILTTYSSKGLVKNNLRQAGFLVKRLPGPPGKRHILRATKE